MDTVNDLGRFLSSFPRTSETSLVETEDLARQVTSAWRVEVPDDLRLFWQSAGAGYFGNRELLFFGMEDSGRGLLRWNTEEFWSSVQPPPDAGGAVFFAENPFGEQLGFRWVNGECQIVLFVVDTMELFLVCEIRDLFKNVLVEKAAITDVPRLHRVRSKLGIQPSDTHYAPIVSPLIGGSDDVDNFEVEAPRVHFISTIATWRAVKDLEPGTLITGVNVVWADKR
jgi:hypothetical protein